MIDLHTHSVFSDGAYTPLEIMDECVKKGVETVSLTDHDTIAGLDAARKAANKRNIAFITGVELSCETDREIHILGFNIDTDNFKLLNELNSMREERKMRMYKMLQKLNNLGAEITAGDITAEAKGNTVGRMHIAKALIKKGYAENFEDAFKKYLSIKSPAYVKRVKMTLQKAIKLITGAKGIPVLAHPLLTGLANIRPLVNELMDYGLMGIEAYYPVHSDKNCEEYESIAMQNKLLVTAGSDFHGISGGAGLGSEKRNSLYLQKCIGIIKNY